LIREELVADAEALGRRVEELAGALFRDYADGGLTVLCIAPGARRFVADLTHALAARGVVADRLNLRVQRLDDTELGPVQVDPFDVDRLRDREVVVVDDIADEGFVLPSVVELIETACDVRSIRTAALIDKRERRRVSVSLDYVGFVVERGRVFGYGIDAEPGHGDFDRIGVWIDERF
jgi:hypoxanthine phosphoribosyltransferase